MSPDAGPPKTMKIAMPFAVERQERRAEQRDRHDDEHRECQRQPAVERVVRPVASGRVVSTAAAV